MSQSRRLWLGASVLIFIALCFSSASILAQNTAPAALAEQAKPDARQQSAPAASEPAKPHVEKREQQQAQNPEAPKPSPSIVKVTTNPTQGRAAAAMDGIAAAADERAARDPNFKRYLDSLNRYNQAMSDWVKERRAALDAEKAAESRKAPVK